MSERAETAIPGAVASAVKERILPPAQRARLASVRVSPGGYLAAACVLTFAATLLLTLAAIGILLFAI